MALTETRQNELEQDAIDLCEVIEENIASEEACADNAKENYEEAEPDYDDWGD